MSHFEVRWSQMTSHINDNVIWGEQVKNFALHGRKVVAIGRNYKLHAEELQNAIPTEPFWFLKPPSAYLLPVDFVDWMWLSFDHMCPHADYVPTHSAHAQIHEYM